MIALLRGKLLEKSPNLALVDVGGVGYSLTIPVSTFSELPDSGAEVVLHAHTHVREDALALFGFLTKQEKALFEKLITVNGVGPRLAVTVLSGLPPGICWARFGRATPRRSRAFPAWGEKQAKGLS